MNVRTHFLNCFELLRQGCRLHVQSLLACIPLATPDRGYNTDLHTQLTNSSLLQLVTTESRHQTDPRSKCRKTISALILNSTGPRGV